MGAVPLLGGDSDIGVGGGALASVTYLEPGTKPHLWRVEVGAISTFKPPRGHGWRVPYQDFYALWTFPHLVRDRLRLEVRPSFTNETTQGYYGIGNAAIAPDTGPAGEPAGDYFQYGRLHATLLVRCRLTLGRDLFLALGSSFTYNSIDVHPGSKLDLDSKAGDARTRRSFVDMRPHAVGLLEYALVYDTRDDETAARRGMYHQGKLRFSPGGTESFPYRYGQVSVITRFYVTPTPGLTFGVRLVFDAQFGDPPFYELARYEDTFALGGANGVRGVPGQRYYGKLKALGNFETRADIFSARVAGNEYKVGLAAFLDGGRLWSDWPADPRLDGTGLGLKWGVGGGLRLQQGKAFVVRGDVAWSPDARPIGAYFTADHTF